MSTTYWFDVQHNSVVSLPSNLSRSRVGRGYGDHPSWFEVFLLRSIPLWFVHQSSRCWDNPFACQIPSKRHYCSHFSSSDTSRKSSVDFHSHRLHPSSQWLIWLLSELFRRDLLGLVTANRGMDIHFLGLVASRREMGAHTTWSMECNLLRRWWIGLLVATLQRKDKNN